MKSLYKIVAIVSLSILTTSCFDKSKPNYQFFPNMYESVGYETYSETDAFKNGKEGQLVPEGAIKRGFVPYEMPKHPLLKEKRKYMLHKMPTMVCFATGDKHVQHVLYVQHLHEHLLFHE